jgi:hypothetical protein
VSLQDDCAGIQKSGQYARKGGQRARLFLLQNVHLRAKEIIREYIAEFYSATKVVTVHPAAFQEQVNCLLTANHSLVERAERARKYLLVAVRHSITHHKRIHR